MGSHINKDGLFQSDKYPTCPAGKVPLSVNDKMAQSLLWEYAQRRRAVDAEFSTDLETALRAAGYEPPQKEEPEFLFGEDLSVEVNEHGPDCECNNRRTIDLLITTDDDRLVIFPISEDVVDEILGDLAEARKVAWPKPNHH